MKSLLDMLTECSYFTVCSCWCWCLCRVHISRRPTWTGNCSWHLLIFYLIACCSGAELSCVFQCIHYQHWNVTIEVWVIHVWYYNNGPIASHDIDDVTFLLFWEVIGHTRSMLLYNVMLFAWTLALFFYYLQMIKYLVYCLLASYCMYLYCVCERVCACILVCHMTFINDIDVIYHVSNYCRSYRHRDHA